MKKLLIDSRVRKVEYEYLSKYFDVIKIPLSNDVYEEISGHSDIFYCKLQNKIICAPNAPIIGSKYTDSMISTNITVKQGYTKCSICVTSKNSCITSDRGIDKILKGNGINSAFIEENNIKLLKKDGKYSDMKGFIGGASFVFDNKFVLFGDIENLESKEKIIEHLKKYELELVDFKGLEVNDYGGVIIY